MKKARAPKNQRPTPDWGALAERRLRVFLRKARAHAGLRRLVAPGTPIHASRDAAPAWTADVRLIGAPAMTRLNERYRGRRYATDVLSFAAPEVFARAGHLGELVICLPVLKRQAREIGHVPERELDVLIVHGILHLLGLDHELGPKHAKAMARWERELLPGSARQSGLIGRAPA